MVAACWLPGPRGRGRAGGARHGCWPRHAPTPPARSRSRRITRQPGLMLLLLLLLLAGVAAGTLRREPAICRPAGRHCAASGQHRVMALLHGRWAALRSGLGRCNVGRSGAILRAGSSLRGGHLCRVGRLGGRGQRRAWARGRWGFDTHARLGWKKLHPSATQGWQWSTAHGAQQRSTRALLPTTQPPRCSGQSSEQQTPSSLALRSKALRQLTRWRNRAAISSAFSYTRAAIIRKEREHDESVTGRRSYPRAETISREAGEQQVWATGTRWRASHQQAGRLSGVGTMQHVAGSGLQLLGHSCPAPDTHQP